MAHEVTKRVGKRAYRYRVESYRDPESSKVRSRWTYLGVVSADGASVVSARRSSSDNTRARLIGAFQALVADLPYTDITAGAVAAEAGLAHGTFYRYFSDKRALLIAAIEGVRRELDRARPEFDSPVGTRDAERRRMREWLLALYAWPAMNAGLYRAFVDVHDADPELREHKRARVAERDAELAGYFERLNAASVTSIENPARLASAITTLIYGSVREVFASQGSQGEGADESIVAGIAETFDRAIFAARDSR